MSIQILWDYYEAALLFKSFEKVEDTVNINIGPKYLFDILRRFLRLILLDVLMADGYHWLRCG